MVEVDLLSEHFELGEGHLMRRFAILFVVAGLLVAAPMAGAQEEEEEEEAGNHPQGGPRSAVDLA